MAFDVGNQNSFFKAYFCNVKDLVTLIIVCTGIAFFTNSFNKLGMGQNIVFSYCFGVSISAIETFLRTRQNPLPDLWINVIAVISGSIIGFLVIYSYLVRNGFIDFGEFGRILVINFAWGFSFSTIAFYFFWSRYRNQSLNLALRNQQLKAAESDNLRQQSENRLLHSQMEPHFLFNTLANIQSLIDIDPPAAKQMLADLSAMLRASLKNTAQDHCALSLEIAIMRAYLGIQKTRMGERLVVDESISDDCLNAKVLPMLIQPVVENSIKHGLEKATQGGVIKISGEIINGSLVVSVEDNFLTESPVKHSHGISLSNLTKRLANAYGDQASITSEAKAHGWKTVIQLPLELNKERKK